MLLQAMALADDPSSAGRQMPCHWGHPDLNIVSQSSPTGSQFLNAVGAADVTRLAPKLPPGDDRPEWEDDELVYVSGGEGCASQGEFFESVNAAILNRLPVLFMIQDNKYAISVPVEFQTPTGSLSRYLRGLPGLKVVETNGLDVVRSYLDLSHAVREVRAGRGPVLVHAHVVRLESHSNSDDQGSYRLRAEIEDEKSQDPIPLLERRLLDENLVTESELKRLRDEVTEEVRQAVLEAEKSPPPDPSTLEDHLYAPEPEPLSLTHAPGESTPDAGISEAPFNATAAEIEDSRPITVVEAIRDTLAVEMARDPRVVIFGEDVADASRKEVLQESKGKGGVFKVTEGLQRTFGEHRVFNAPLAEAAILGRAIGMATRGLRPVVEIQFFDYIWPAMMQIRNELGMLRWRSCGQFSAPVVIRVPTGGYLRGGGPYHSQSAEGIFCQCPGLRIVMPSNAEDAVGLLRTSIRSGDPVIFFEHKHLYRQPYARRPYPGSRYQVPFGKAEVVRDGRDMTIVTYGALVHRSVIAARRLATEGIEIDVIDLRSIKPYDFDAIAASVKRTSRLLVVTEESPIFGVGAEIAARASEELFLDLDAPVRRLGARDLPVAFSPLLEEATLPQIDDVVTAAREVLSF
jgi:2-oxoisovalerate dehydrogenase E1 component